jgi:DNA-binding LacI/PurR family transcriptional regulator
VDHQVTRRVTIADVAEAAGVSKTAVSFAFNNPGRLNVDTASRIMGIADSLGYRPDPVARMLTQRRTGTIGVLTPQALALIFSNPFFGMFSAGVAAVAEEAGYGLHFISPLHGSLSRAIARATVDGVVAIGLAADHPEITEIRRAGLPMTTVDSDPFDNLPSVDVDDEGGAKAAAEHLIALGHRDVLVIGIERAEHAPSGAEDVVARRLRGYRTAFAAVGIEIADADVIVSPATFVGGVAALGRAWDVGRRPTAVLAMSDAIAIGAIRGLRDRGLSIPGDVSVVGFDDIELALATDPPLTTIHQPIRGKGEEAARLLLSVIASRGEQPGHRRLATRLVIRASTGPVAPALAREVTGD